MNKFQKYRYSLRNVIKILFGQAVPLSVRIQLTKKCNLQCSYCSVIKHKSDELSITEWESVIRNLNKLGTIYVAFQGGEPLIYKDYYDVIAYAANQIPFVNLTTNGTLLTEEIFARLSPHLSSITVSIDKLSSDDSMTQIKTAHSQDILNKLSTWQKRYGVLVQINIVLSKANYKGIIEYVDLINTYNLGLIVIPVHSSEGQWYFRSNATELEFSTEDYFEFDSIINELIKRKQMGRKVLNTTAHLEMMKSWIRHNKWSCDAGKYYFDINPDGRVMICEDMFPLSINLSKPLLKNYFKLFVESGCYEQRQNCFNTSPCCIDAYYPVSHIIRHPLELLREFKYIGKLLR